MSVKRQAQHQSGIKGAEEGRKRPNEQLEDRAPPSMWRSDGGGERWRRKRRAHRALVSDGSDPGSSSAPRRLGGAERDKDNHGRASEIFSGSMALGSSLLLDRLKLPLSLCQEQKPQLYLAAEQTRQDCVGSAVMKGLICAG